MQVRCPRCNTSLNVPDKYAGKTIKCPACNKPIALPEAKAPAEEDLAHKLDFDSLEAVEHRGEALEFQKPRKRMTLKQAQEATGKTGTPVPTDPNVRICPNCGTPVHATDPYSEILCLECDHPIPGIAKGSGGAVRYADSLKGRMTVAVTFYSGFGSAMLYPIPALIHILLGMALALAAIVVPSGVILAFTGASSLNPISERSDFTWVGLFLTVMFIGEGIYFGAVNFNILVDSIRVTASGGENPPGLTFNPGKIGAALGGYIVIALYYAAIFTLLNWRIHGGLDFPNTKADVDALLTPGNIVVLALVTFMIPMNLIGLASSHPMDGLNPMRVGRSIRATAGPYVFLFLIVVLYVGIYSGIMVGVMSWAGGAILLAAREGIGKGVTSMGAGLLAWAVVIGAGFFINYSLGRILGLFARTYREQLDFDM